MKSQQFKSEEEEIEYMLDYLKKIKPLSIETTQINISPDLTNLLFINPSNSKINHHVENEEEAQVCLKVISLEKARELKKNCEKCHRMADYLVKETGNYVCWYHCI